VARLKKDAAGPPLSVSRVVPSEKRESGRVEARPWRLSRVSRGVPTLKSEIDGKDSSM